MAITPDPTHPGTLYVGSDNHGIWKSTDYGNTWARSDVPFPTNCGNVGIGDGRAWTVAVDEQGSVFTTNGYGCAQGLFKSTDGGVHFTQVLPVNAPTPDIYTVQIDPYLHGHMIASPHSNHACADNCDSPVGQSFDHGNTWTYSNPVPGAGWQFEVFFLDNSASWLAASQYTGLYRTTDAGQTWTKVSSEDSAATNLVKVGTSLFLGTHSHVVRSTDNGVTWADALATGNPFQFNGLLYANGKLYTRTIGVGQGPQPGPMKESVDGITWTNGGQVFNNGPFNMNADGQYAYAALEDGGLWRLPLGQTAPTATPTAVVSTATPTPTAIPSTSTPGPTSTPTSTPTSACQIVVRVSGQTMYLDEAPSFCAGAHP